MSSDSRKSLILLYHFFHPDDVISARLYADIAKWAAADGWNVIAMPSIRSCHNDSARFSSCESIDGYSIHRVWRPAWSQSSTRGRLGNTICMLIGWSWRALVTKRHEVECMIVGTDPPLSALVSIPWKLFRPRSKVIHWCHDLYPQAAVAEGMFRPTSVLVGLINRMMNLAYRFCTRIVDLGPCMRAFLETYTKSGRSDRSTNEQKHCTITPWALVEPEKLPEVCRESRQELFGEGCKLAVLYSGNLGRAHSFDLFTELAANLRESNAVFCFAGRGPKFEDIRNKYRNEPSIRVAGFSSESNLMNRLASADIHMVSLQQGWTGCVVPSKFFGALSAGRPVLFEGSRESSIARWILEHQVGWVMDDQESVARVSIQLSRLAEDRQLLHQLQQHCLEVYREHFSKVVQMKKWKNLLSST